MSDGRGTAESRPGAVRIEVHDGDRSALMPLLELADDSTSEIATYRDRGTLLTAIVDGEIVGQALLLDDPEGAAQDVKSLAVAPGHQRRGIGSRLLDRAAEVAASRGFVRLGTSTATADISNLRFYQRNGFRMLRIERDAFTTANGYSDLVSDEGIAVRDRVFLDKVIGLPEKRKLTSEATIEARHDISAEGLASISERLHEHNQRITGEGDARGLSFVVLDRDQIVGAATGYSWSGIAELEVLWIDEARRGIGLGTRLIEAFVQEAARRGLRRVWVSSHDFQAPELYERAGFDRIAELDGWPEGHTNVILCKRIGSSPI